jgi:hypothetical protein
MSPWSRSPTALALLGPIATKIDDPRSLHEPFVRKNRAVLDTFLTRGAEEGAAELERYLVQSERVVLGAFARMQLG